MNGRRWRADSTALVVAGVVGLAAFVVAWEVLVRALDVRPFVLRAPSKIVPELFDEPRFFFDHTLTTGVIRKSTGPSFAVALSFTRRFADQVRPPSVERVNQMFASPADTSSQTT